MTSARFRELAYPLMRMVIGLLLACHGAQKIFGTFGGAPAAGEEALMTLAGVIELFGGFCIAIGLFTSPVAFLASGQMAVAYFMVHAPRGLWPIENGGELAVVYSFVLLAIAARGGGEFSIDRARKRREDRASAVLSSGAGNFHNVQKGLVMKSKTRFLLAALAAGCSAIVIAQEPMRSPTPNPMPKTTSAPAPTAAPGVTLTPGGGDGARRTPPSLDENRPFMKTPRARVTPMATPGR